MGNADYKRGPLIGEQGVEVLKELGYDDAKTNEMLENKSLYVWSDPEK